LFFYPVSTPTLFIKCAFYSIYLSEHWLILFRKDDNLVQHIFSMKQLLALFAVFTVLNPAAAQFQEMTVNLARESQTIPQQNFTVYRVFNGFDPRDPIGFIDTNTPDEREVKLAKSPAQEIQQFIHSSVNNKLIKFDSVNVLIHSLNIAGISKKDGIRVVMEFEYFTYKSGAQAASVGKVTSVATGGILAMTLKQCIVNNLIEFARSDWKNNKIPTPLADSLALLAPQADNYQGVVVSSRSFYNPTSSRKSASDIELIGEIELPRDLHINSLQAGSLEDSLLVTYTLQNNDTSIRQQKAFFIPGDNPDFQEYEVDELMDKTICAVVKISKDVKRVYYVIEQDKSISLKAVDVDFNNSTVVPVPGSMTIKGTVLGFASSSNEVHIYSVLRKQNLLTHTTLIAMDIIYEKSIPAPFNLALYNEDEFAFFQAGKYVGPMGASAIVKIFDQKDKIRILVDEFATKKRETGTSRTLMMTIDKTTGGNTMVSFPIAYDYGFNSMLYDSLIFRVTHLAKQLELNVLDIKSGKVVNSQKLPSSDQELVNAYARNGYNNLVGNNVAIDDFMKRISKGKPFMVANQSANGDYVLTWGVVQKFVESGILVRNINPLASLFIFAATTAVRNLDEQNVYLFYIYITGSPPDTFRFITLPDNIRSKIDTYEINEQKNHVEFLFKSYYQLGDDVIAFYYVKRYNSLRIVRFSML